MHSLINDQRRRRIFILVTLLLLLSSIALVAFKLVTVKMLPFDNKSEMQVVIDMPEGTTLEQTARVTSTPGIVHFARFRK